MVTRTGLRLRLALLVLTMAVPTASGHETRHAVTREQAVIVHLSYADETPFSFESYEIYREGEEIPYQVGRTDKAGRVAFLPDRAGTWRLRAFSDDGHGVDVTLTTDAGNGSPTSSLPFYQRHARILVGVGVILGVFGLVSLLYGGRQK